MEEKKAIEKLINLAIKAQKIARKMNKEVASTHISARDYGTNYGVTIYLHDIDCEIIQYESITVQKEY